MSELIYEDNYFIFDRPIKKNLKFYIKRILYPFVSIYYKLLMYIFRPRKKQIEKKYNVSICAIFKDEATYLKEWIEFHKIVGVEHFYLYNNNSSDNYKDILKPYIDDNIVTLIDWPQKQCQVEAYQDCAKKFSLETKWIAYIDLDEFIIPNQFDDIYSFLKQFDYSRPVVIVYWKNMGSSGKMYRDLDGLVIEDFVVGFRKCVNIGKCFFNTNYKYPDILTINYVHHLRANFKNILFFPVNVFDNICLWGMNKAFSENMPIQINHFLLKSFNEYVNKKSKRGGGIHVDMHNLDYFWNHESKCQAVDYHAYKYLIKLKLAMNKE